MNWEPIETAPRDVDALFWVVPKTADETYLDSSDNQIFSGGIPYLHRGKYGNWSSLSKATHWMKLPEPPT